MLGRVSRRAGLVFQKSTGNIKLFSVQNRGLVYKQNGGVLAKPEQIKFGFLKACVVIVPFLSCGMLVSKYGAILLGDYGIFVPDDNSDD